MFLFSFGTRPEIIKQFPLIQEMKKRKMPYKTLFTGQHEDLVKDFINLIGKPDYSFKNIILIPIRRLRIIDHFFKEGIKM